MMKSWDLAATGPMSQEMYCSSFLALSTMVSQGAFGAGTRAVEWRHLGPPGAGSHCFKVGMAVCRAGPGDESTRWSSLVSQDFGSSTLSDLLLETRGAYTSQRPEIGHRKVLDRVEDAGSASFTLPGVVRPCFATLSAPAHTPPAGALGRPTVRPAWITGGALLSLVAGIVWYIHHTETNARKRLIREREDNVIAPPRPPEMVERYERARASVEQTGMITRAISALQRNDFIKCIVEVELALEQNRTARCSVTSEFYEEGQLQLLYRTALKIWLDGYPLDYGNLLQLRELLAIPTADAEAIEADVQRQSDVYVI